MNFSLDSGVFDHNIPAFFCNHHDIPAFSSFKFASDRDHYIFATTCPLVPTVTVHYIRVTGILKFKFKILPVVIIVSRRLKC